LWIKEKDGREYERILFWMKRVSRFGGDGFFKII